MKKKSDIPVVAFIVYNGKNKWNPLEKPRYHQYPNYFHDIGYPFKIEFLDIGHALNEEELKNLSPITLVALTALKYIVDSKKFPERFQQTAIHLLHFQNTQEGKDFLKQTLSYFAWKWQYKKEDFKMDSPEAVANKGYESFAEHFINVGIERGVKQGVKQGELKGALTKAREMAKAMLADKIDIRKISLYSGLSEAEIKSLS